MVVAGVRVTLEVHGVDTTTFGASVVLEGVVDAVRMSEGEDDGKVRGSRDVRLHELRSTCRREGRISTYESQRVSWESVGKPVHPTFRSGN